MSIKAVFGCAAVGALVASAVVVSHGGDIGGYGSSVELLSSDVVTVQVDWTGIGIYPQVEPYFGSGVAGDGYLDKDYVNIVCETYGESVSNGQMYSDIWARLDMGGYLPNSFLNTGVDGRTPGVPDCGDIDHSDQVLRPPLRKEFDIPNVAGREVKVYVVNDIVLPTYDEIVVPWDGNLTAPLFSYWLSEKGGVVQVPWSYFSDNGHFSDWIDHQSFGDGGLDNERFFKPSPTSGDVTFSVGSVRVYSLTRGCYLLVDTYDFDPDKLQNLPYYLLYQAEENGWSGKNFGVVSTNC